MNSAFMEVWGISLILKGSPNRWLPECFDEGLHGELRLKIIYAPAELSGSTRAKVCTDSQHQRLYLYTSHLTIVHNLVGCLYVCVDFNSFQTTRTIFRSLLGID